MSVHLGALYHWSPKRNRESILREGLQIMRPVRTDEEGRARFPWVCLGSTPSSAWGLIGDPLDDGADGEGGWDLWQVSIREGDSLTIRGDFAPHVREVRVHHGLPPDRLWWIGERGLYAHLSIDQPAPEPPRGSRHRRPKR